MCLQRHLSNIFWRSGSFPHPNANPNANPNPNPNPTGGEKLPERHIFKHFLGYRSRTRTLTLNPNPNPITDPNPNPNPKNKRKQIDTWIKFNIELYLKVNIIGQGVGL